MKANYYAIIPANVRYSNMKANSKLLYGEISALSNKHGFCFATNKYFAELYNVSKVSIQKWLKQLEDKNYISNLKNCNSYQARIIGLRKKKSIPDKYKVMKKILLEKKIEETEFDVESKFSFFDNIKNESNKISSFVTIQEGCDKFCNFCVFQSDF